MRNKEELPNEFMPHVPVMLREVIEYLQIKAGGNYLDCTFGAGGYSKAILAQANCQLTAIDQDPNVAPFVKILEKQYPNNFAFIQDNFANASCHDFKQKFDGIVLDLGVSSMQLDEAQRGFSFSHNGPLDMRMNQAGKSAQDFIMQATEQQIADVLYLYGDETKSRRIAKAIVEYRQTTVIDTTEQLAQIVRQAIGGKRGKIDPATKSFQAIRIYVNQEMQALETFLANAAQLLLPGGRLVVVSFHSLEDGIVKNFFKINAPVKIARSKYAPLVKAEAGKWVKIITKRPLTPANTEVASNPRSRSAKMRVVEKIKEEYVA